MSRVPRARARAKTYVGYKRDYVDGNLVTTLDGTVVRTSTCNDWIGRPVEDMSFDSQQKTGCLLLNGSFKSSYQPNRNRITSFDNFPLVVSGSPSEKSVAPIQPPSGWALDVVARTNPSRPVMTPLTLLQDIIELPSMLLQAGRLLKNPRSIATPKGAASSYLGTLFGWMPLVDDIKHLLEFQSYADKRAHELNKLFTNAKGLKRRIDFGSDTTVSVATSQVAGQGSAVLTITTSRLTSKRAWATIRWRPAGLVPYHPSDADVNKLARRVVSGMTTEGLAKGLWDVVPWTWMINWFTNIGKYALAHSNTVPATHSKPCFMSEVTQINAIASMTTQGILDNQVKATLDQTFDWKTRTVSSSITPGFYLPFLDRSRLSILGALGIQKWKPFL